jgi:hypothetical protein
MQDKWISLPQQTLIGGPGKVPDMIWVADMMISSFKGKIVSSSLAEKFKENSRQVYS